MSVTPDWSEKLENNLKTNRKTINLSALCCLTWNRTIYIHPQYTQTDTPLLHTLRTTLNTSLSTPKPATLSKGLLLYYISHWNLSEFLIMLS